MRLGSRLSDSAAWGPCREAGEVTEIYSWPRLAIYEQVHYSRGEHVREVEDLLAGCAGAGERVLDLGCGGGLHALEFARRGYRVTGVDVEPSAIALARKRNSEEGRNARFEALDLERGDLSALGVFDLVYAIGNVLSHVAKDRLGKVLDGIRGVLDRRGVFIFDLLSLDPRLPSEAREPGTDILWKRIVDPETGGIDLTGYFPGARAPFRFAVWGYEEREARRLLKSSGFVGVEVSRNLRFDEPADTAVPAACLRFRARGGFPATC
jgi:SAM-dependent methyltransferase